MEPAPRVSGAKSLQLEAREQPVANARLINLTKPYPAYSHYHRADEPDKAETGRKPW